ncbi:MAG: insulinase family protein [Candidatus Heimdallarchaeota archaeon]|nr:MAG: insulinase family protein [Candidatus Heimdallarchaeota archaeon]
MNNEQSELVTLDNNLKLQLVSIPGGKTALFAVGFHAGSMYEKGFGSGSNDGISHFLEHMFFKGTPTKTAKQVNEAFTRLGADLNAFTSYDHTVYYAKVPTRNLRHAAEIWKDLLVNDVLNPEEFKAEKQVILQEIQLYADMPEFDTNYTVRQKQFSGTALEHNILGTPESVGAITLNMMTDYITQYYSLDNAVVTLVGGFDLEGEKQYLTSIFNEAISEPRPHPIFPPRVTPEKSSKNSISYSSKKLDKPLTYVALSWATPGINSSDFYPLLLLNTFIGNSRTSLLYREITSKGIASVCRFGFEALFDISISGIFFISPPKETKNVFHKVMDLLVHVHDLEITPQTVNDLKEETLGSYTSEIEDPTNYGIDLLQKYIKFRHPLSVADFLENISKVSVEDIQTVKNKCFENLNLTMYATGSIPSDWDPQFPKNGPW